MRSFAILILALFSQISFAGGSNTGPTLRGSSYDALIWCNGTVGVLKNFRAKAEVPVLLGDMDDAESRLEEGIARAMERPVPGNPQYSLLYIALQRGLEIIQVLHEPNPETGAPWVTSELAYQVLSKYYDFMIEKVNRADIDYFIPYNYDFRCQGCRFDDQQAKWENRFTEYAKSSLAWINDAFVLKHERNSPGSTFNRGAIPTHSGKFYLKMAGLVINYAIEDLQNSIWTSKFACVVDDLRLLSEDIANHLGGSTRTFGGNDRYAVNLIYNRLVELIVKIAELERNGVCRI